jgi:hypothetical protein
MRAQAAVTGAGALVGGEKRHPNLLAVQHLGHQGRDVHVAGVKGQVQRLRAAGLRAILAESQRRMGDASYEKRSDPATRAQTARVLPSPVA